MRKHAQIQLSKYCFTETARQGGREGERKGSMDDIVVSSPVPPAQPFPKLQKAETRDPKQPLHLNNMLPLRCTIGDHLADFKARTLVKHSTPRKERQLLQHTHHQDFFCCELFRLTGLSHLVPKKCALCCAASLHIQVGNHSS